MIVGRRKAFLAVAVLLVLAVLPQWGASQALAESPSSERVEAIAYKPSSKAILLASEGRLLVSDDHGATWNLASTPVMTRIASIAVAANGAVYTAGDAGLLQSEDGKSFIAVQSDLSGEIAALAAHTTQPGTLYAAVDGKGIFRSKDAGTNWTLMDVGPPRSGN